MVGLALCFGGDVGCSSTTPEEADGATPAQDVRTEETQEASSPAEPDAVPATVEAEEEELEAEDLTKASTTAPPVDESSSSTAQPARPVRNEPFEDAKIKELESGLKPLESIPAPSEPSTVNGQRSL
jgi:hypothetical protein